MLLRQTIRKTKLKFHKTLRNFKSLVFGGYQKLPRSLSFNPFTCSSGNARTYTRDQYYNEFYDQWQSDLNRINRTNNNSISRLKEPGMENDACPGSFMSFAEPKQLKSTHEDRARAMKNKGNLKSWKKEDLSLAKKNGGAHVLAQKMKDLEMLDSGDVEQVLDIEEALHYYSRLTSPVYLDIVDKFFMDMHSELSVPQSSVSIKHSKGRLCSIRCR